jgi:hypothetical protein
MLFSLLTIEPDTSASVILARGFAPDRPAIHWTPPPHSRTHALWPDPTIQIAGETISRPLTVEEERLVWESLRASSELVYTL